MVRFPWRVRRYEFLTDSAGAGKWRGALGIWRETVNEGGDTFRSQGAGANGFRVPGEGRQGGHPTPLNVSYIQRGNEHIKIENPHLPCTFKTGDLVVSLAGGGAGVGPPEERDPEAVKIDVKNELVSVEAARNVYKVVLKPGTLEIDCEATKKLRE